MIQLIVRLRIGQHGLRPFGSRLSISKLQHQCMGSRIQQTDPKQACKSIPLQGVYHRVKLWLKHQYTYGFEPRKRSMVTRFELELASEIGVQRALERLKPDCFQAYVLNAAKYRLQGLQADKTSKSFKNWQNKTFLPAVGGRLRHGQNFCLTANPPSQLKCQIQWA